MRRASSKCEDVIATGIADDADFRDEYAVEGSKKGDELARNAKHSKLGAQFRHGFYDGRGHRAVVLRDLKACAEVLAAYEGMRKSGTGPACCVQ
ncbi:unnamed protein product [Amoebophrya sp. A25]|nr:unnamed protein product [Amoebophrya sp. A25]|eukprot:GSA25T00000845001.1